jgi:DNA-binding transcriptional regulator YhcF (GntR family)
MPAISDELRHRCVFEYEKTKSFKQVANKLGVSRHTVKKWVTTSANGGVLKTKKGQGRKKSMSAEASSEAVDLLLSGKYDGSQHVARELRKRGLTGSVLHRTTVAKYAKAKAEEDGHGIVAKRGKPVREFTAKNKAQRLAFCEANKTRNWANVMFTDRNKFMFRYPGTAVKPVSWVRKGEQRKSSRVNKPSVVNMYAGLTKFGVTQPHLVTGTTKLVTNYLTQKGTKSANITQNEYVDVAFRTLIPGGTALFSVQGSSEWVFQQDGDPTHKEGYRRAMDNWKLKSTTPPTLLTNWPPNSPDSSPIENAWGHVSNKVDARGCDTFDEYKAAVFEEWKKLDKPYLTSLIGSLKKRMQDCIAAGGDKIDY